MKRFVLEILVAGVFLIMPSLTTRAQTYSPYDGFTPSGLEPGKAAGGFALSDFDNVNIATGSLNLSLPLLQIGGRGSAGYTMMLRAEYRPAVKLYYGNPNNPPSYGVEAKPWYEERYNKSPGLGAGLMLMRWSAHKTTGDCNSTSGWGETLTRYTFVRPDGSEIEFVDATNNGQPRSWVGWTGANGCQSTHSRGAIWYSTDGSGMTFIADNSYGETIFPPAPTNFAGNLMMKDGTLYRILSDGQVDSVVSHMIFVEIVGLIRACLT